MRAPIPLRPDYDGLVLRRLARASAEADQTRRLLALASIYDGGSRRGAAKLGGVGLQVVRDWVTRFNPRPRTGGDLRCDRVGRRHSVSIHAPARGATGGRYWPRRGHEVFQSTPPHGGRLVWGANVTTGGQFQSTPPHGGRRLAIGAEQPGDAVSIHAPARGATFDWLGFPHIRLVSIHAPARGATPASPKTLPRTTSFNPRPRTGGDVNDGPGVILTTKFQSTPPHGGRRECGEPAHRGSNVSIHAPARGATYADDPRPETIYAIAVSIHAPARGATRAASWWRPRTTCFNPRPRTGGDDERRDAIQAHDKFQSTPPHGGRRVKRSPSLTKLQVSIHAPARGATSCATA